MKIDYEPEKIRKYFEGANAAELLTRKCGKDIASGVSKCMYILRCATSIERVFFANIRTPHWLKTDLTGCFSLDIDKMNRIIVKVKGFEQIGMNVGKLLKVDHVIIKGVCDDHERSYKWLVP